MTFDGLTLIRGSTIATGERGGAIRTGTVGGGDLIVQNCVMSGNSTWAEGSMGGGIYAFGSVTVTNSTISGNSTSYDSGGGIFALGSVTVSNSTISGNSQRARRSRRRHLCRRFADHRQQHHFRQRGGRGAAVQGGGIYAGGTLTISNSTISGNSAQGGAAQGGGIYSGGPLTISNSTISGNSTAGGGAQGGGVYVGDSLTISNSTISGNSAQGGSAQGGGIFANNSLSVTNSTITDNSVTGSGGNGGGAYSLHGPVTIRNSIVAGNRDTENGSHPELRRVGTLTVEFSLIGDKNGNPALTNGVNGNLVGTHAAPLSPQLGPLQNNGGSTETHALIATSPAIDAGAPGFVAPPNNDQRGAPFVRVADGPDADATARVDMGAVEFQTVISSTLVVDTAIDENDGNYAAGDISLRDAVALANARSGPHTITFAAALAGQPVLLSLGQMIIRDALTIRGLGAGKTTVNGQGATRLFDITSAAGDVTFDGLTLTGGKTTLANQSGGAIRSASQLTIQNCTISGNSTAGTESNGGGIFAKFSLSVANSTISGNFTSGGAFSSGGGIYADSVTVVNSTISGNSVVDSYGGGIAANHAVTITNSTITANSVTGTGGYGSGGGVSTYSGPITITNSIVAKNSDTHGRPDLHVGISGTPSVQFSLIGTKTGTNLAEANPGPDGNGNKIGGPISGVLDPRLSLLAFNGGVTRTHRLLAGSPALNAGSNDLAVDPITSDPLTRDQRGAGFPRINFGTVDMGAVEYSERPVITSFGDAVTYTENAAPTRVATAATVSDSDLHNFEGGRLVAQLTANAQATDRLTIVAFGNVSTNGNQVLFAEIQIGTFSGGAGGAALTIVFNTQSNANRVQAVLRGIGYEHTSDNPSATARTLAVFLTDGDGGASATLSKTINVVPVNDAPQLGGISGTVGYTNASPAIALASAATVTDADSPNFDLGKLTVFASVGAHASNRIELGGTLFTVDASNNVRRSGVIIGTLNANGGVGTTKFEVTFNGNATAGFVQQLVRALRFRTINSDSPDDRELSFRLTDGDGGISATLIKTVQIE